MIIHVSLPMMTVVMIITFIIVVFSTLLLQTNHHTVFALSKKNILKKKEQYDDDFMSSWTKSFRKQADNTLRRQLCPPSVVFTSNLFVRDNKNNNHEVEQSLVRSYLNNGFTQVFEGGLRNSNDDDSDENNGDGDIITCRTNNPNQIPCNTTSWPIIVSCWIYPPAIHLAKRKSTTSQANNIKDYSSSSTNNNHQRLKWDCDVEILKNDEEDGKKKKRMNEELDSVIDEEVEEIDDSSAATSSRFLKSDLVLFGEDVDIDCQSSLTFNKNLKIHKRLPDLGHVKTKRADLTWKEFEEKLLHAEAVVKEASSVLAGDLFDDDLTNENYNDDENNIIRRNSNRQQHHQHLLVARAEPDEQQQKDDSKKKIGSHQFFDEENAATTTTTTTTTATPSYHQNFYCYRWIRRRLDEHGKKDSNSNNNNNDETDEICHVTFSLRDHDRFHVLASLFVLLLVLVVSLLALVCRPANHQKKSKERVMHQVLDDLEQQAMAKAFCTQKMKENEAKMRVKNQEYDLTRESGGEDEANTSTTTRITTDSYPIDEIVM